MSKEIVIQLTELQEYQERHFKLLLAQLPESSKKFMVDYLANNKPKKEETIKYKDNIKRAQEQHINKLAEIEKKEQRSKEEQELLDNPAARNLAHFYQTIFKDDSIIPVLEDLTINSRLDGADLSGSIITNVYFKTPLNSTLNLSNCEIYDTKFETKEYRNTGSYTKPSYELDIDFPNMNNTYVDSDCMATSTGYTFTSTEHLTKVMERQGLDIIKELKTEQFAETSTLKPTITKQPSLTDPVIGVEAYIDESVALGTLVSKEIPNTLANSQTLPANSNLQDLEEYAVNHRKFLKTHGGLKKEELKQIAKIEGQFSAFNESNINDLKKYYSKAYSIVKEKEASFSEEVRSSPEFSSRGSYAEYLAITGKTASVQPVFQDFTRGDAIDTNLTAADLTGTIFKNCQISGEINATTILANAIIDNTTLPKGFVPDLNTPAPQSTVEIVKNKNIFIDVATLTKYAELHRQYLALQKAPKNDSELFKARAGLNQYLDLKEGQLITLTSHENLEPIIQNCDLSQADLSGVNFNHARFEQVKCTNTKFDGAKLDEARFEGCDFVSTSFARSTLSSAYFDNCKLDQKTSLDNAKVDSMYIKKSDIETSLSSVVVEEGKTPLEIEDSNIALSSLPQNVTFKNSVIYPNERLIQQYAEQITTSEQEPQSFASFIGVAKDQSIVIKDYDFSKQNLTNANFTGVTFDNVNFKGANISNVNFTKCNMDACDLKRTNFAGANLSSAIITDCRLAKSNFAGAEMKHSIIERYHIDLNSSLIENKYIFKGAKNFSNLNLHGDFPEEFKNVYTSLNLNNRSEQISASAKVLASVATEALTQPKNAVPAVVGLVVAATLAPYTGTLALAVLALSATPAVKETVMNSKEPITQIVKATTLAEHKEAMNKAHDTVKSNKTIVKRRIKMFTPSMDKVIVALTIAAIVVATASTMGVGLAVCLVAGGVAAATSYLGYSSIREKALEAKDFIKDKVTKLFSKEKSSPELVKEANKSLDVLNLPSTIAKPTTALEVGQNNTISPSATPINKQSITSTQRSK